MSQQYYTPSIDELFVGYECEIRRIYHWQEWGILHQIRNEPVISDVWAPVIVGYEYPVSPPGEFKLIDIEAMVKRTEAPHPTVDGCKPYIEKQLLRTPYLTVEAIEKEGWKNKKITKPFVMQHFEKTVDGEGYVLVFKEGYIGIYPNTVGTDCLFRGRCKSVNELRKAEKMIFEQ